MEGQLSVATEDCHRIRLALIENLAGVRRYGGTKWSDRGALERTFLASDQQSNRAHGVYQRLCVCVMQVHARSCASRRAVPVLQGEHRPPFLL